MEDMKKLFHSIPAFVTQLIIAVFLIPIFNCLSVHDTFMYGHYTLQCPMKRFGAIHRYGSCQPCIWQ